MHIRSERKRKVILTKIASLSFLWIPCESYFSFQTYLQHQPFSDCTKSYWLYSFQLIIEIMTWQGRTDAPSEFTICFFSFMCLGERTLKKQYVLRHGRCVSICFQNWNLVLKNTSLSLGVLVDIFVTQWSCQCWEKVVVLVLVGLVIVLLDVIYIFIKKLWSVNIVIKLAYEL